MCKDKHFLDLLNAKAQAGIPVTFSLIESADLTFSMTIVSYL